ncbi:MAG TPA: 6-phosphofructokinase, partial [Opitutales bacterium]|nr:6-phosphofructokinase [Opitutales bacterium]
SQNDIHEAQLAGQAAVVATTQGKTARMITLTRAESDTYKVETSLVPLSEVCGSPKNFPATWISEDGNSVSFQLSKYALPLL